MLTDLFLSMQPKWWHRMMWLFGLDRATFHEFLEGFCPCGEFDALEDDLAA